MHVTKTTPTFAAGSPQNSAPNSMRRDGVRKRIGAYSRQGSLALIDGRCREAQFVKRHRADLARHCGGSPSTVQAALIERCCWLALRLAQLEAKMATGELTEHDSNHFIAWSNAYARTIARLGPTGAVSERSSIDPHLAALTPKQREAT